MVVLCCFLSFFLSLSRRRRRRQKRYRFAVGRHTIIIESSKSSKVSKNFLHNCLRLHKTLNYLLKKKGLSRREKSYDFLHHFRFKTKALVLLLLLFEIMATSSSTTTVGGGGRQRPLPKYKLVFLGVRFFYYSPANVLVVSFLLVRLLLLLLIIIIIAFQILFSLSLSLSIIIIIINRRRHLLTRANNNNTHTHTTGPIGRENVRHLAFHVR